MKITPDRFYLLKIQRFLPDGEIKLRKLRFSCHTCCLLQLVFSSNVNSWILSNRMFHVRYACLVLAVRSSRDYRSLVPEKNCIDRQLKDVSSTKRRERDWQQLITIYRNKWEGRKEATIVPSTEIISINIPSIETEYSVRKDYQM